MSSLLPDISTTLKIIFYVMPILGFSETRKIKNIIKKNQEQNNPPSVKLINLSGRKDLHWNSFISYKITVTDKEDGLSEKNEIPANEVLLKVKFLPDSISAIRYLKTENNNLPESRGIRMIKSFNCFTCHRIKSKFTGPSFDSVVTRYPPTQKTFERLTDKIIKGSKSVWGQNEMPPHPDVKAADAQEMLKWIFKNSASPDLDYLVGFDGIIHTKQKPVQNENAAIYVLTASYTDHGMPGKPNSQKRGQDILVLKAKFENLKK